MDDDRERLWSGLREHREDRRRTGVVGVCPVERFEGFVPFAHELRDGVRRARVVTVEQRRADRERDVRAGDALERELMVHGADANLARLARIVERDLGVAVDAVPGAGAAGGMGAAMLAFFGATLKPGIEIVTAAVDLDDHVRDADLIHVHAIDFFFDYFAVTKPIHRKPMIATTHGGSVTLEEARPGQTPPGALFTIRVESEATHPG